MKISKKGAVTKELTRAERNRRNNVRRTVISAAVAFVLFIALTVIQSSILNQEKKDTVYQVIKDIQVNTRITEENFDDYFKLKSVQISLIPDNYITSKSSIVGKYVKREYKVNDIITNDGLKDIEKDYKAGIENPIEISFDISDLGSGVAGTLREGDFINIYGISRGTGDKSGSYILNTELSFEKVYIAAAFDGSGNRITSLNISDDNTVTMLTLILSEKDAAKFTEMLSNCQIHIAKVIYNFDVEENSSENDSGNSDKNNGSTDGVEQETTGREEETVAKPNTDDKKPNTDGKEEETVGSNESETSGAEKETSGKEDTTTGNKEEATTDRDVTIPTGGNSGNTELEGIFG